MRLQQTLERYLPLIGNMLFPAAVFAAGLLYFLSVGSFSFSSALFFHYAFYALSLVNILILLNFNRGRFLFFIVTTVLAYVLINYLKHRFGAGFSATFWYRGLEVLTPLNLLVFYRFNHRRFFGRWSLLMLVCLIIQYTAVEFLGRAGINPAVSWNNINIPAAFLFILLIVWAFVAAVKDGRLADYGILFAGLGVGAGFYWSAEPSGLSLFFCLAQFILSVCLIYDLVYNHYYDELTGFYGRNSYLLQSKHFPLKYSLGIVCIDNYDKLLTTIGRRRLNLVVGMVAGVLEEMNPEEHIYRYTEDEFIIMYKKLDKKEAFARLDDIRRTIAGLEFIYNPAQKALKLTVSCSVAEKKRSDSGAVEVLMRADKAMRNTLKFSHNVTSQG